jgi:parallel beta-helix repeat protein
LSAVAPTRDQILLANHISHLTFDRLSFAHSEWNLPEQLVGDAPQAGGFGQAEVGVSASVSLAHCTDSRIENCQFLHLGNYALELGQGCQHDEISRCTFSDLGSGGIKIGETEMRDSATDQTFGNIVSDCKISDAGHIFPSACGIWLGQASDNRIVHNELSDLYYTAISIGWTWGYGPSLCKNNQIQDNLIHDIGKKSNGDGPILSDMGAVYTLGARAGTIISGNVFHDISGRIYGGWGIYLDAGSSDEVIENNLVYRTTHGGFHVNYGQNNLVRNNIFALNRDIQIARTITEPGRSFTFKNNIVYWNTGVFTVTDPPGLEFDNNLYRCFGSGKFMFGDRTFDQWKSAGRDIDSVLADPGFIDPAHGNFSLPADSSANRIHFAPVSFTDAGPRTP